MTQPSELYNLKLEYFSNMYDLCEPETSTNHIEVYAINTRQLLQEIHYYANHKWIVSLVIEEYYEGNYMNMLNLASKDLMDEFLGKSLGRVLPKSMWGHRNIPQGVSVYIYHPATETFEYLFTKDDRIDFKRDEESEVIDTLYKYAQPLDDTIYLYMHTAMLPIISKHRKHPF